MIFLCGGLLFSCQSPENQQFISFQPEIPAIFGDSLPQPERNRMTQAGVDLGKKLFFDPILSGNNQISCATCHQPEKAFSDGLALSDKGVSGKKLKRHVPSLINLAWQQGFFWDGGVKDLESLPVAPITDPDEMGQNLRELCQELQKSTEYPSLFRQAFGSDSITSQSILRALAQFHRTLISADSKFDDFLQKKVAFSETELQGMHLFEKHCQTCHQPPFFTDFGFHNNGLDIDFPDSSDNRLRQGRSRITNKTEDLGKYKTPTLRKITFTAPYMHDGRFENLEQVILHYSENIRTSVTLDEKIPRSGFQFSITEQKALLDFLKTLAPQPPKGGVENSNLKEFSKRK